MKHAIFAAVVVAYATGTPASAADMPIKAPPPAPLAVNDWSGFYLGAHGGYGWGREHFSENTGATTVPGGVLTIPNVSVSGLNSNGFVAGFQAGYNWQYMQWVGGLEIDLSGAGIKGSVSNVASAGASSASVSQSDKIEMLGSARARIGYLVMPNFLFYGTGGLGWTRDTRENINGQTSPIVGGPTFTTTTDLSGTSPLFGWVAGVGGEAKILDSNWLLRVEYLHYDFGDLNSSTISVVTTGVAVSATPTVNNATRFTTDVVRAGLSYKFGGARY